MNKLIALSMMALLSLGLGTSAALAEGYGKQKVVYHINMDDEKTLKGGGGGKHNHTPTTTTRGKTKQHTRSRAVT